MKKQVYSALRIISALIAAAAAALSFSTVVYSEEGDDAPPETSAYAYCLYCCNNGEVIAEKNADERLPMASTTKIMTAVLGLEAAQQSENEPEITITPEMYAEGSSMYLADGETVTLTELVGGMLMVSGNDAANAVAMTLGGSREGFADMMNEKAYELGLSDTHFVTPSGLDADGHFTTARDLARLMAYCMENEAFAEIDRSSSITVHFLSPAGKTQTYYNENKLLNLYEYCVAGKTGFTDKAGRTLVSCAEKDGIRLAAVTLNDGDDWNDHISLFDYGFGRLSMEKPDTADPQNGGVSVPVVGGETDELTLIAGEPPLVCSGAGSTDVTTEYELPHFVYAPIKKGEKIGELKYYTGGVYAGKADVTAQQEIAASQEMTTFTENIVSFFRSRMKR